MSKAGRKRKANLPREANGRIQRPTKASEHVYWQRERDALRTLARDSRLGSPLGILFRAEKITSRQFAAGLRFAEDRKAADAALSLPARTCQAQDIVSVRGGAGRDDGEQDERRKAAVIRAYDSAMKAVVETSPEFDALQQVAIHERTPDSHAMYMALVSGLDRLARFYGLGA